MLAQLTGQGGGSMELPQDAILIAEDLTPSDTAQFDAEKVAGFATIGGGASSHVAIIAAPSASPRSRASRRARWRSPTAPAR